LPNQPSKRKLSTTSTSHNPSRPLKILAGSSLQNQPNFSFDFSSSQDDSHRIFSNETIKQHLSNIHKNAEDYDGEKHSAKKIAVAPSITLSLFTHLTDPNLTWKTKLGCFAATLGINFFLPFINGVMLGLPLLPLIFHSLFKKDNRLIMIHHYPSLKASGKLPPENFLGLTSAGARLHIATSPNNHLPDSTPPPLQKKNDLSRTVRWPLLHQLFQTHSSTLPFLSLIHHLPRNKHIFSSS
jgi:hypothetical protein